MDDRVEQVYELSGGWVKRMRRKSGASVGQWDAYLFAPDGTKIRSNQDLIKYCAATGTQIDPFVVNMDKSCVKDKPGSGSRTKPSKGVIQLRDALRRMGNGGQSMYADNSFRGFTAPGAATSSSSTSEYYSDAEVKQKTFSKQLAQNPRVIDLTREDCPVFIDMNTIVDDGDYSPAENEAESLETQNYDSKFESQRQGPESLEGGDVEGVDNSDKSENNDTLEEHDVHIQEILKDDPFIEMDNDIEKYEHEIELVDDEVFEIKREDSNTKNINSKEPFYKGCEYLCKVCSETRDSVEHIRNHMRKFHPELQHTDPSNYDLIREEYFDCVLCDANMLRDYLVIKMHVRSRHKMGMVEYARDHVNKN